MKRIPILLLLLSLSAFLHAQLGPAMISFEPGNFGGLAHNPAEGQLVDNNYFSQIYGVTFRMGSLDSNLEPYIAQVGQQGTTNGFGFVGPPNTVYSSNQGVECTVPSSIMADKPAPGEDVGCFFLTDDPNGPGRNPQSLFAIYEGVSCSQASGFLLDVDGKDPNPSVGDITWQEGWMIIGVPVNPNATPDTVYLYSPNYQFFDPNPAGASFSPTGDGVASFWQIDLGTEIIHHIEFDYIGSPLAYVGIAFDNFNLCGTVTETNTCCEGANLIPNGNFESGNTGFISTYTHQATLGPNSIIPGQYGIVTPLQASTVSAQWDALNHTNCGTLGRFMAVNGRTMTSGGPVIVYQQNDIPVDPEKEYVLCYYYRHLPQCAFDVWQDNNLQFGVGGGEVLESSCSEDTAGLCGWTKRSFSIKPFVNSNSLSFALFLTQNGIGDGNDFALDDFSLTEKGEFPAGTAAFNAVPSYAGGSTYPVTATAVNQALPAGATVTWRVEEYNCNTLAVVPNSTQVWTNEDPFTTGFPGYCCNTNGTSPGIFRTNRCYNVYRTVSGCCFLDQTASAGFNVFPRMIPGPSGEVEGYEIRVTMDGKETIYTYPAPSSPHPAFGTDLQLYPNPGNGNLNLRGTNSLKGLKITVSDINGKALFTNRVEEDRSEIEMDLTELPSGMYLIQLQSEDGSVRQEKYVKQ